MRPVARTIKLPLTVTILFGWLVLAAPAAFATDLSGLPDNTATTNSTCQLAQTCRTTKTANPDPGSTAAVQSPYRIVLAGLIGDLSALGRTGMSPSQNKFLPPDQVFILSIEARRSGLIHAHWAIADGYYLYRNKFGFTINAGKKLRPVSLPAGKKKHDEAFGDTEVFYRKVDIDIPLPGDLGSASTITLMVTYQGCADAGFCYPPVNKRVTLVLPNTDHNTGSSNDGTPGNAGFSSQDNIANSLVNSTLIATVMTFFGFGLLLAFTPCVFPMVPILSGLIIGQGQGLNTRRAFLLSLAYVLAMALTYTLAGIVAGKFGQNMQAVFQNPWIIALFSGIFVVLALSMFGFFELQLPARMQTRLTALSNRQHGGTLIGAAIMGLLSALIVGPCIAAPLAGALIYIGQSGDALRGGTALFALSMGMGLPLLVIGTSAGKLLPKAGPWMNIIKIICGVILLWVAIWLLERIIPTQLAMLLWATLFIVSSVYMGVFNRLQNSAGGWQKLWKGVSVVLFVYGTLIMIGAASGAKDVFRPLHNSDLFAATTQPPPHTQNALFFKRIKGLSEFDRELKSAAAQGKPVMLDFYADWCVACKEMEEATFSNRKVRRLLGQLVLLQADVTANDQNDRKLLRYFGLFGPPSILFFDTQGSERRAFRLVGFKDPASFYSHLQEVLKL